MLFSHNFGLHNSSLRILYVGAYNIAKYLRKKFFSLQIQAADCGKSNFEIHIHAPFCWSYLTNHLYAMQPKVILLLSTCLQRFCSQLSQLYTEFVQSSGCKLISILLSACSFAYAYEAVNLRICPFPTFHTTCSSLV